jgi:two-component system response regulator HydG
MNDAAATPIHVLIVDNDQAHAEAVAESLERVGYQCAIATSGPEAVEKVRRETYDVVVTDLVMNEIDGIGVLVETKKVLPDSEVILLTGHGTIQSAVEAIQQGAFNYLLKPLDIKELPNCIASSTSGSGSRASSAPARR